MLDRQLRLISSCHWGAAQIGYLGASVTAAAVIVAVAGWLVLTVGPTWTGLAGGGALLTGAGARLIRNRRKCALDPNPEPEPEPGRLPPS